MRIDTTDHDYDYGWFLIFFCVSVGGRKVRETIRKMKKGVGRNFNLLVKS